jgi:two-component sensor histidine kinase
LGLWGYTVAAMTPVLQVTSELVTNAVLHAATAMRLDLTLGRHGLRCSVRDYSTAVPTRGCPGTAGGYGMRIVDGFAQQWGVLVHPDGKTVWARFERPQQSIAAW